MNERSSEAETELERFMSKGTVVASEAMHAMNETELEMRQSWRGS